MTIDEYTTCLDIATAKLAENYTINVHLSSGETITNTTPEKARGTLAVIRQPNSGNVPDSYWWIPLDDIIAVEVVGTLQVVAQTEG